MALKGAVAQLMRLSQGRRFEKATWSPQRAQWDKLQQILKHNADTEFGREHRFAEIQSVADFQARVPIRDYEGFRPWIERMTHGEQNVLTAQKPIYYCRTSGTTGEPKLTAITEDYRDEYQSVVHSFLYYMYREHPRAFDGQAIYFNGAADYTTTPDGSFCGSMSGFNSKNLPPLLKRFYAAPYEIMVITDTPTRHFCVALLALVRKITLILAVTPSPPIYLAKTLAERGAELIAHLQAGTLPSDLVLTPEERALMTKLHRPNPQRAQELRALLKAKGQLTPTAVWPQLDLLVCWKTSTAGSLLPRLEQAYPDVQVRDAIYSASEGWCNVPYTDKSVGGPLAVNAHFYEFLPVTDSGGAEQTEADTGSSLPGAPRPRLAHELKVGQDYRILITNSAGMYRYDLGDILHVSHYYHQTPSVYFVRKVGQFSNLVTEMLAVEHVLEAMEESMRAATLSLPFYVLVPEPNAEAGPRYRLYLEAPELDAPALAALTADFEARLKRINFAYQKTRESGDLSPLQWQRLPAGSFDRWRAARVAAGADDAQIKPPGMLLDASSLQPLLRPESLANQESSSGTA